MLLAAYCIQRHSANKRPIGQTNLQLFVDA